VAADEHRLEERLRDAVAEHRVVVRAERAAVEHRADVQQPDAHDPLERVRLGRAHFRAARAHARGEHAAHDRRRQVPRLRGEGRMREG